MPPLGPAPPVAYNNTGRQPDNIFEAPIFMQAQANTMAPAIHTVVGYLNSISETNVFNVLSKNVSNRAMGNTQPLGIIISEAARADLAARCRTHQVDTSSQEIATANDDRIGYLLRMALTAATRDQSLEKLHGCQRLQPRGRDVNDIEALCTSYSRHGDLFERASLLTTGVSDTEKKRIYLGCIKDAGAADTFKPATTDPTKTLKQLVIDIVASKRQAFENLKSVTATLQPQARRQREHDVNNITSLLSSQQRSQQRRDFSPGGNGFQRHERRDPNHPNQHQQRRDFIRPQQASPNKGGRGHDGRGDKRPFSTPSPQRSSQYGPPKRSGQPQRGKAKFQRRDVQNVEQDSSEQGVDNGEIEGEPEDGDYDDDDYCDDDDGGYDDDFDGDE